MIHAHVHAKFTEGPIFRHVLTMLSTSALSLLTVFMVDILTLIYVSRLGDQSMLAALGLAKTLIFINGAVGSGMVIAAGVILSQSIGRHAARKQSRLVTHMLLLAFVIGAALAGVEGLCMAQIARWLTIDAQVYRAAQDFIWLALPSSVLSAIMQMCAEMLRTRGHARLALAVVLSGAVTLGLADPLFIFGLKMGLMGAGLSYFLSASVSLITGLVFVKRRIGLSTSVNLKLFGLHSRYTLRVALPIMLSSLAMPVGITYLITVLSGFGASALAGMAVIDRALQIGYCAFFALPSALVPVIAQNLGAGLDARARRAIIAAAKLVVTYAGAYWLLLNLSGQLIPDYVGLTGTGRDMFMVFAHYGAGLWIVLGLDFVGQSMFLTMGRTWWLAAFSWARGTLGTIPFVFVGGHWFGGGEVMLGLWTGNALVSLAIIAAACWNARQYFRQRAILLPVALHQVP